MSNLDESAIRKALWARKDATDAKMSEPGFEALPADEQDAWVVSLMLDLPFEQARAFIDGSASTEVGETVRAKTAEAFKHGKRRALRELKATLARHSQDLREEQ